MPLPKVRDMGTIYLTAIICATVVVSLMLSALLVTVKEATTRANKERQALAEELYWLRQALAEAGLRPSVNE